MSKSAVLVVDVQNDFCPGGSLAVKDGDKIIPYLNMIIAKARLADQDVIFTRDWHPRKTKHFAEFGGVWPVHCVQNTLGSDFHRVLDVRLEEDTFIYKGMDPEKDAFSGFDGGVSDHRPLNDILKARKIQHLTIGGLATDYCVKATVLDALKLGYRVTVPKLCIAAVNLNPLDCQTAILEMSKAGAMIL